MLSISLLICSIVPSIDFCFYACRFLYFLTRITAFSITSGQLMSRINYIFGTLSEEGITSDISFLISFLSTPLLYFLKTGS